MKRPPFTLSPVALAARALCEEIARQAWLRRRAAILAAITQGKQ